MGALSAVFELVARTLGEWRSGADEEILFAARNTAFLAGVLLTALTGTALVWRAFRGRVPGRSHIALPAIVPLVRRSSWRWIRHGPFVLFLVGLPLFGLALADPYTSLQSSQRSYPGRRIAVVMDASVSMWSPFSGQQLKTQSDTAFSNTMAAADYFVRMRMRGRNRDLIALEQFGSEAYVITPFTTDYENLLLSLQMISDVAEWQRFPDQGTTIMKAIDVSVELFRAFDFLKFSGNLMVIFSDGQDNKVENGEVTLAQVLKKAVENEIPVYMIRTAYGRGLYELTPDTVWKKAIDATGGRFFPAANQETIMQAIKEIDAAATGRVEVREYRVRQSRFARFVLPAVLLWTISGALQMTLRTFRTFP